MTYDEAVERRVQLGAHVACALEQEARAARERVRALLEAGKPVTAALRHTMQHRLRAARLARAEVARMQREMER